MSLTSPIRLPRHDGAHLPLPRGGGRRDPELVQLVREAAHLRLELVLALRVRDHQLRVLPCPVTRQLVTTLDLNFSKVLVTGLSDAFKL